eukprot:2135045-Alexandrium_andersonii.AAC.1
MSARRPSPRLTTWTGTCGTTTTGGRRSGTGTGITGTGAGTAMRLTGSSTSRASSSPPLTWSPRRPRPT